MFGKAAITITHGQRVLPARALELGYEFGYPTLTGALADLIGRAGWCNPANGSSISDSLDARAAGSAQARREPKPRRRR